MAKKKEAPQTHDFVVDVSKFSLTKEKYVDALSQYIQEQIKDASISKDSNVLTFKVPQTVEKRLLRFRINKFLYASGLKNAYKLVDWLGGKGEGYQIIDK